MCAGEMTANLMQGGVRKDEGGRRATVGRPRQLSDDIRVGFLRLVEPVLGGGDGTYDRCCGSTRQERKGAGGRVVQGNGWERDRRNEVKRGKGRFSQLEYFRS